MQEQLNLAWAAGLFDGEGTVRCKGRYRIVSMHLTDLPMLQRFQTSVGGIGTIGDAQHRPNRKPIWQWWACAANAVEVADLLLPFVADRNRARFNELKAAYAADKSGTCEYCGVAFTRVHSDRRFCSKQCSTYARRARQRAKLSPERRAFIERKSAAALRALSR